MITRCWDCGSSKRIELRFTESADTMKAEFKTKPAPLSRKTITNALSQRQNVHAKSGSTIPNGTRMKSATATAERKVSASRRTGERIHLPVGTSHFLECLCCYRRDLPGVQRGVSIADDLAIIQG